MAIYDENSTQHSYGLEQVALIKQRKPRKKKEFPYFYPVDTTNSIRTKDVNSCLLIINDNNISFNGLSMCPYTELIPLSYLLHSQYSYNQLLDVNILNNAIKHHPAAVRKKILAEKRSKYSGVSRFIKTALAISSDKNTGIEYVKTYLSCDYVLRLNYLSYGYSRVDSLVRCFQGNYSPNSLSFRTYLGYVGLYSLYRDSIPEVIAVVLPENYIWQKLHIALTGQIDLKKVVILVNRELDSTSYPVKAFRTMYKKHIEPLIKESACTVWKVPVSYIQEKCFLNEHVIDEMNIVKRKQKIEEFAQAFISSVGVVANEETALDEPPPRMTDVTFLGTSYTYTTTPVVRNITSVTVASEDALAF